MAFGIPSSWLQGHKMPSQNDSEVPSGQSRPSTPWTEFGLLSFIIKQELSRIQTATLVRVDVCTNSGGLSPVGLVDVTPLVNQIDSTGTPYPHATIYNIPYLRIQGGTSAIIIDPKVGDIGVCVFASRDISKVKSSKQQSNPGSYRKFNFSDGMYIGGMLNGTPTQYIQFSDSGIKISSPTSVTIESPSIVLAGAVSQTGGGSTTFSGSVSSSGISLSSHVHTGVVTGTSDTGTPI